MSEAPRLCSTCAHHKKVEDRFVKEPGHMCTLRIPDVVYGGYEFWLGPLCQDARYRGPCGVEGKFWEAADAR